MRLAYHGATSMKAGLMADVEAAARAGFSGLEIWAAKADAYLSSHSLGELGTVFRASGVTPVSINSIEFIGFRGEGFSQIAERCRELCAMAGEIECPVLVVVPSPTPQPSPGPVLELFYPWEKIVDEYVDVLRRLSEIARPYGVRLAFEFLGFAWCSVRTPKGAWEIIRKAGCDNVGMNFDACHFYGGGGELAEIDLLDPQHIYTFHLNDMEAVPKEAINDGLRLLPGEGVIPLGTYCERLSRIGYDGPCSIELFRAEYWEWDPLELARRAHAAAVKVLSPYFDIT